MNNGGPKQVAHATLLRLTDHTGSNHGMLVLFCDAHVHVLLSFKLSHDNGSYLPLVSLGFVLSQTASEIIGNH